jgi:hypothetical protein
MWGWSMSRLIDPGPGEVFDRLTILALKILYGEQAGKDVSHFTRERAKLLPKVTTFNGTLEGVLALGAVNAALWQAEDALRKIAMTEPETDLVYAGQCGLLIQRLNDQRAALVWKINATSGESHQEKL